MRIPYMMCVMLPLAWTSAAVADDCGLLLNPDTVSYSSNKKIRLSLLRLMDKKTFDERKTEAGGTVVIYGYPFGVDYADAKQHSEEEFQKTGFSYDEDSSMWYVANRVPEARSKDFLECINGQGVKLRTRHITDDSVDLEISWTPPPGENPASAQLDFQVQGGTSQNELPATIAPGAKRSLMFRRSHGQDFRVAVDANGYTSYIFDPRPIVLKEPPVVVKSWEPRRDKEGEFVQGGDGAGTYVQCYDNYGKRYGQVTCSLPIIDGHHTGCWDNPENMRAECVRAFGATPP